jgi:four helix bundle protein
MSEKSEELKARTEEFAVATVKFCDKLPNSLAGRRISQQLIDASTSIAANYRATRARMYLQRIPSDRPS